MVGTCIYKGLARGRIDRLYLCCLPFGYVGVCLLLHFGTDLPLGWVLAIALLVGDAPAAILTAIVAGFLALVAKPEEDPASSAENSAGARSAGGPKDQ